MKNAGIQLLIYFAAAMLAATAVVAAPSPTATLTLEPPVTLPGLPVAFNVMISNPGDDAITLTDAIALQVETGSDRFLARTIGNGRTAANLPEGTAAPCNGTKCFTVPPHGQRQLYVDYGPELARNEFFADERLNVPGAYELQLLLYPVGQAELRTNSARLTISNPSGADAQAWQLLRDHAGAGGVWGLFDWATSGAGMARMIRTTYAASGYAPWVVMLAGGSSREVLLREMDAVLSANPTPSLRDNILSLKAASLEQWSGDAVYGDRNLDQAVELADKARAVYTTLQKVAISEVLRKKATDALPKLFTAATAKATLQQLEEGNPPAPAPVVPRVECIEKGPGNSFTASFGYANPNPALKVLQIGNLNQVTPAPRDQGQPRVFSPGDRRNVFTAASPGGQLKWHLDGNVAVANADFSVLCTAP
jgi:hypothetical protein